MLLEALVGSVLIYYGTRQFLEVRVSLKTPNLGNAIWQVRTTATGIVNDVRNHLMTRSQREELEAREKAQSLYDSTLDEIFKEATPEEKQAILDIFSRYSPSN